MKNHLTILLYHGVTNFCNNGIENFSGKHIPLEEFEEQIRFLQGTCTLLSMDEVVEINKNGCSWPKNATAVTFDDGFQNNYSNAAPILDKYNCPSTFYVCAGMVNTDLMFWVDIIEDCINRTHVEEITFELAKPLTLSISNDIEKISAVKKIKNYCKNTPLEIKDKLISELVNKTGISPSVEASPNYKMMSWTELKEINSNPLFSIGGHTLYHDIMALQDEDRMALDVDATLCLLNYNLKQITTHYAYPEGQHPHYSEQVISTLKNKGIVCSPSAIDGVNMDEDLFHLKRIMPNFMGRDFPNW